MLLGLLSQILLGQRETLSEEDAFLVSVLLNSATAENSGSVRFHEILTRTQTHTHKHEHTQSSDLWTNKPALLKDRIWPLGGGTHHFLPTSTPLLSPSMVYVCACPYVCVCVCVMWLVPCFFLNTDPSVSHRVRG